MFSRLIQRLKGVLRRMFARESVETVTGEQITLSNEMIQSLELWEHMLEGNAPWVERTQEDGVKSLKLESAICREFANVSLSEMETKLENESLNALYQDALSGMNEAMQDGLGLGSFVVKPIASTGEYEYIPANRIVPLEYGSGNKLRRVAFIQVKPIGDYDVYYRLEIHELIDGGLRVTNRAYRGTQGDFGMPIQLTDVEEWASLEEQTFYPNMDRMDFGFYRNPIPNRIDGSANGVSIFNDAIQSIRKADIQFGRIDWEYSSGERLVFADYTTVKKTQDNQGAFHWKAPKGKDRMFVGVNGADDQWTEHSPALRDASYINGLNEYKRQIEFACSLAYGDLSKNESVEKTAQEIKASKNRKYNMVNAIQKNLRQCLEDLAWAIAFYNAQYNTDIGFQCVFHDSIKTDEDTERQLDIRDVQMGFMSKVDYRMKWYGETEEQAQQKIAQITAENMALAQAEGDIA